MPGAAKTGAKHNETGDLVISRFEKEFRNVHTFGNSFLAGFAIIWHLIFTLMMNIHSTILTLETLLGQPPQII